MPGATLFSDMFIRLISCSTSLQPFLAQIPARVARLLTNETFFFAHVLLSIMRGVLKRFMELH
jgi:hypothetical protein